MPVGGTHYLPGSVRIPTEDLVSTLVYVVILTNLVRIDHRPAGCTARSFRPCRI